MGLESSKHNKVGTHRSDIASDIGFSEATQLNGLGRIFTLDMPFKTSCNASQKTSGTIKQTVQQTLKYGHPPT